MASNRFKQAVVTNSIWFLASLGLAFVVWFVATTSSDPIAERVFARVPVQIELDENLIVIGDEARSVRATARARQSVLDSLTNEDIVARADLRGLGSGTHTVSLEADAGPNRNAFVETQPTRMTFTMERLEVQQKPVEVVVINDPPANFAYNEPVANIFQAEIRGPSSKVSNVAVLRAQVDLANRRNDLEEDVTLIPLDAEGRRITDVAVTPQIARVSVDVFQRSDVAQVSITPNLLADTLAEGYRITSVSVEPETIFIRGLPSILEAIGDTFSTGPIDLSGRTEDFEVRVPVNLRTRAVSVFLSEPEVNVKIGITEETTSTQIDNIVVRHIGVNEEINTVRISPETISVILSIPVLMQDEVSADDIQAIVDLTGLDPGNHGVAPLVSTTVGQISSVIPSTVSVTITPVEPPAQQTASPDEPEESESEEQQD